MVPTGLALTRGGRFKAWNEVVGGRCHRSATTSEGGGLDMDNEIEREAGEGANQAFRGFAYVVVDDANCLYEPRRGAAIRMAPPYGSMVSVVSDEGAWVLINCWGKEAWSPRENLSPNLVPARSTVEVGIAPSPNYSFRSGESLQASWSPEIEYGPRGGRFVRTASGFRRYF